MAKKIILIIGSNRDTGELNSFRWQGYRVYRKVDDQSRKIEWEIDDAQKTKVRTFLLEGKDPDQTPHFDTPVPKHHDTQVKLRVKKDNPPIVWECNIIWKDKFNKDHKHDTKISVLLRPFIPTMKKVLRYRKM